MIEGVDDINIRRATNRDGEKIRTLVFGVLAEYGLQGDIEATDSDLKDIDASYFERGGIFELIEDREGNLLGTVGLYPLDQQTCELRKMYFLPQVRGKGLGRHILARTIAHARTLGFKTVILETASVLKEAIRLYTRFGFQPINAGHLSSRCDQAYSLEISKEESA